MKGSKTKKTVNFLSKWDNFHIILYNFVIFSRKNRKKISLSELRKSLKDINGGKLIDIFNFKIIIGTGF